MTDPNTSPVSLPAGSFDYDGLKAGLNKAAKGSAKSYDQAVADTLKESSSNVHDEQDPRSIPGYRFTDVKNDDLGVTERIQVFDPKLAEEAEQAAADAIADADTRNTAAPIAGKAIAAADSPKE